MTNEQEYLNSLIGKENHFKVPDGYFDRLTAEIMDKLPEQAATPTEATGSKVKTVIMRPWLAAASIAAVIAISATLYFSHSTSATDDPMAQTAAVTTESDSYFDDAADYMMIDHKDIYACLASE